MLLTFLHSVVHYIPSENTVNNQDVDYPDIAPALSFLASHIMLHSLIITRLQFMLSNILQVQMNMQYLSILQLYYNSILSHIITIRTHTQKQRGLPRKNSTNSQPSAMPTGVVNYIAQLDKELLFNCSKFALNMVFSSATLEAQLHGNQSVKIKHPSVPMNTKS